MLHVEIYGTGPTEDMLNMIYTSFALLGPPLLISLVASGVRFSKGNWWAKVDPAKFDLEFLRVCFFNQTNSAHSFLKLVYNCFMILVSLRRALHSKRKLNTDPFVHSQFTYPFDTLDYLKTSAYLDNIPWWIIII